MERLCLSTSFSLIKIFPGLYNFPDAHAIFVVIPPTYTLHMDTLPSSMPTTQFTWHFAGGICILFTLGNRFISCYTSHATLAACQRDLPVNIQHKKVLVLTVHYLVRRFGLFSLFNAISTFVDYLIPKSFS